MAALRNGLGRTRVACTVIYQRKDPLQEFRSTGGRYHPHPPLKPPSLPPKCLCTPASIISHAPGKVVSSYCPRVRFLKVMSRLRRGIPYQGMATFLSKYIYRGRCFGNQTEEIDLITVAILPSFNFLMSKFAALCVARDKDSRWN